MWKTPRRLRAALLLRLRATSITPSAISWALVGALLVGDHVDFARRRQIQHGAHKILAERAIDPGGAQDRVVGICRSDRLFAREFSAAVLANGAGRIIFAIRTIERAVEHVVGRQVHDRHTERCGDARDLAGADRIDGMSLSRIALRKIDRGVGRRIHHDIRPCCFQRGKDLRRLQQIELRPSERDDLDIELRPALGECAHDLALRTGDDKAQACGHVRGPDQKYAGNDLNAGWRVSLSDSTASSFRTGQLIARSGSSHAIPRSLAGE